MLEKMVTVEVTHPMGSTDEKKQYYPINCGYIREEGNTTGEKAYIFGVNGPVMSYLGRVIASVRHENDPEGLKDAYVIAPYIHSFRKEYIEKNLLFAEEENTFHVIML